MPASEYSQSMQSLFEAAQRGDQHALDRFLRQLRPQILATCYRLLGKVDDAEDAAQDAMLAIVAGMDAVPPASSWRPLVFGSAVDAGLRALPRQVETAAVPENVRAQKDDARARQVEPLLTGQMALHEIDALEFFAERSIPTRESLALVFVNVLQLLQPEVRAVYVLADLLGGEAAVVAQATQLAPRQVTEYLAMARRVMEAARAKLPRGAMLPSHPNAGKILRRLGRALIAQDAQRAMAAFDLDAVLVIPGIGSFTGHEAIATQFARMFMVGLAPQKTARIEINGQPALVFFQKKEERGKMRYFANLILAATIAGQPPHVNKILRLDVVTEGNIVKKIGEAARRVKSK